MHTPGGFRSGYYESSDRPASATAKRRDELKLIITLSFNESDGTDGRRRVHADLVAWGIECGLELVRKLTRELGPEPCQPATVAAVTIHPGIRQAHDEYLEKQLAA